MADRWVTWAIVVHGWDWIASGTGVWIVWAPIIAGKGVAPTVSVGVGREEGRWRVLAVRKASGQYISVDAQTHHGKQTARVPGRQVEAYAKLRTRTRCGRRHAMDVWRGAP